MTLGMTVFMLAMVAVYSLQSLFCKLYSGEYPGKNGNTPIVFSVVYGAAIAIFSYAVGGFEFAPSLWTVIFGTVNGIALFAYNVMLIKATASGPYSIVNVMMLCPALIMPILSDTVFFEGEFSPLQIFGAFMLIFGVILMGMKSEAGGTKISGNFWLFCIILGLSNGIYSSILSAQSQTVPNDRSEILIITFSVSSLLALALLVFKNKKETISCFKQNKKSLTYLVLCCAVAAAAPNMLVYSLERVGNSAVVMTVVNGGVIVMSAVYSVLIFKERLKITKAVGLLLALASCIIASI